MYSSLYSVQSLDDIDVYVHSTACVHSAFTVSYATLGASSFRNILDVMNVPNHHLIFSRHGIANRIPNHRDLKLEFLRAVLGFAQSWWPAEGAWILSYWCRYSGVRRPILLQIRELKAQAFSLADPLQRSESRDVHPYVVVYQKHVSSLRILATNGSIYTNTTSSFH